MTVCRLRLRYTPVVGLLAVVLAAQAGATPVPGTCTVTSMATIAKGGAITKNFVIDPLPPAIAFNVSVDASTGAFTFDRTGWPNHYVFVAVPGGDPNTTEDDIHAALTLPQDTVTGTIDAAGNITLPDFTFTTATDYCHPDECSLDATATLTTGFAYALLSGQSYATRGVPLDFQTGSFQLQGAVPWPDAPGGGSVTGLLIACTLAPIPTGLPAAPTLTAHKGQIKMGPPLPSQVPPDGKVVGDAFTLKAVVKKGAAPIDPHSDVWLDLSDAMGHEVALFYVGKDSLQGKGKTVSATDTDGSVIHMIAGRKSNANVSATLGGHVVIKATKKTVAVTFTETGIDFTGLGTSAQVTLQLGSQALTAPITIRGTGAKRKFH